jgi:copper chaperone CopZ
MSVERVNLNVTGMTCGNCARNIERKLAGTPGVKTARVDLAANTATVEFDPSATSVAALAAAIEKLGYQAKAA